MRRTPLGMFRCWRWQHLQRHSLNSSRCENQFTAFKWILKCSEKQLKEAGKGGKKKKKSCSQTNCTGAHKVAPGTLQYQKVQLNSRPEGRWNTFNCSARVLGKLLGSLYMQSIPLPCLATAQGSPVLVFSQCTLQQVKLACCYFCLMQFFCFGSHPLEQADIWALTFITQIPQYLFIWYALLWDIYEVPCPFKGL